MASYPSARATPNELTQGAKQCIVNVEQGQVG